MEINSYEYADLIQINIWLDYVGVSGNLLINYLQATYFIVLLKLGG